MNFGSNENGAGVRAFRERLLAWYNANARDLPWRARPNATKKRDPYRVWVSEIMLQQTRVSAVIEHYHEFLRRFPTVQKLAKAREASVLAAWSGLGYYRRARMLHAAAKVVVRERDGEFPTTAAGWRELPGIGRYTAAAIASIAFDEAAAVVDGNVERVLQRTAGERMAAKDLWRAAEELLDRTRPGDFNQAMMELGAMVCTPRAPACLKCPVVELCATRGEMKSASKLPRQKKREIDYALDVRDGAVFLVQRAGDARLMAGMWELPEITPGAQAPSRKDEWIAALKRRATQKRTQEQIPPAHSPRARLRVGRNDKANGGSQNGKMNGRNPQGPLLTLRHSITVTDYTVRVWRRPAPKGAIGEWISVEKLTKLPLTGLTRKILRGANMAETTATGPSPVVSEKCLSDTTPSPSSSRNGPHSSKMDNNTEGQ